MDAIQRQLTASNAKGSAALKQNKVFVDQAIADLEQILEAAQHDPASVQTDLMRVAASIKSGQAKAQEGHKEWHAALNKLGKEVDKKFNAELTPLLPLPPPQPIAHGTTKPSDASTTPPNPFAHMYFADEQSRRILDGAIAMHFVREGQAQLADTFVQESGISFPAETRQQFVEMHQILDAIKQDDLEPALKWAEAHRDFLKRRDSPLEFHLHRSRFVRLLLSDSIPLPPSFPLLTLGGTADPARKAPNGTSDAMEEDNDATTPLMGQHLAYAYARQHFAPFFESYSDQVQRLLAAALFLPLERLLRSPYADVFSPVPTSTSVPTLDGDGDAAMSASIVIAPTDPDGVHAAHLVPLFSSEFCASLNMSRDLPLRVATDIGGGGALAKLAKVRSVMKEKRTEWTTVGELPVEIALPAHYRFHSVFTCPVSKEQATDENPPMMMTCGHVIAKDSLTRLSKGGNNVKCPYCPQQSSPASAVRLYF